MESVHKTTTPPPETERAADADMSLDDAFSDDAFSSIGKIPQDPLDAASRRAKLAAARAIPDDLARIQAFFGAAIWLPDAKREAAMREILAEAKTTSNHSVRCSIFSMVAPFVRVAEREAALQEVLAAARATPDDAERGPALMSVAPFLREAERLAVLLEVLAMTRTPDAVAYFVTPDAVAQFRAVLAAYEPESEPTVENREKAEFDTSADGTIIPDTPQPEQILNLAGGQVVGHVTVSEEQMDEAIAIDLGEIISLQLYRDIIDYTHGTRNHFEGTGMDSDNKKIAEWNPSPSECREIIRMVDAVQPTDAGSRLLAGGEDEYRASRPATKMSEAAKALFGPAPGVTL